MTSILDLSPYHSFDSRGFRRHFKNFTSLSPLPKQSFGIITGGSSGIGLGVTQFIKNQQLEFIITGRDLKKAKDLTDQKCSFQSLDLSDWESILKFTRQLDKKVDYLVLNAGGMPDKLIQNPFGYEYQCASQLIGHYLLFRSLHEAQKLSMHAKIIWVSSGGMYLKKLDLENLFFTKDYDKVATYANVKRAQVYTNELLAQKYPQYFFSCMHPGWVKTEAVREALPGFYQWTEKNLRTIEEGSDTINFLLSSSNLPSGKFWFDREMKNPNPPLLLWTISSEDEKKLILNKLEEIYQEINLKNPSPSQKGEDQV